MRLVALAAVAGLMAGPVAAAPVGERLVHSAARWQMQGRRSLSCVAATAAAVAGYPKGQALAGRFWSADGGVCPRNERLAAHWLSKAAAAGDPSAAVLFARLRPREAQAPLLRAANAGYLPAQLELARLLWSGAGGRSSTGEALGWYRKAARDFPRAAYELGLIQLKGERISPNIEVARTLLERAGHRGYAPAALPLSQIYERGGPDTPQDLVASYAWALIAVRQRLPGAAAQAARLESRLTPRARARAHALAQALAPLFPAPRP